MCKITPKLKDGTSLVITDDKYQLKCLIEYHGEIINQIHCIATIEEKGRWEVGPKTCFNPPKSGLQSRALFGTVCALPIANNTFTN